MANPQEPGPKLRTLYKILAVTESPIGKRIQNTVILISLSYIAYKIAPPEVSTILVFVMFFIFAVACVVAAIYCISPFGRKD